MFAVVVVTRTGRDVTQLSHVTVEAVTYKAVGCTVDADAVGGARVVSTGSTFKHCNGIGTGIHIISSNTPEAKQHYSESHVEITSLRRHSHADTQSRMLL